MAGLGCVRAADFFNHTWSKELVDEAGETSAENGGMSGGTRQSHFEAQWDFASAVPTAQQPDLSVVASPDRGDGARMSWVQMLDTPTGLDINFNEYIGTQDDDGCAGTFVQTNVATGLSRTVPHTIKITMDFVDGERNDVVNLYVDGALGAHGDELGGLLPGMQSNPTRTVDSILFRASIPHLANAGNGFLIDNFSMTSGPPLPPDETPPTSAVEKTPTGIKVTVQDTGSGLKSIERTKERDVNAITVVEPFMEGETDPVKVTSNKIDQTQPSQLELTVTDVAGNVTVCCPVLMIVTGGGSGPRNTEACQTPITT